MACCFVCCVVATHCGCQECALTSGQLLLPTGAVFLVGRHLHTSTAGLHWGHVYQQACACALGYDACRRELGGCCYVPAAGTYGGGAACSCDMGVSTPCALYCVRGVPHNPDCLQAKKCGCQLSTVDHCCLSGRSCVTGSVRTGYMGGGKIWSSE